MARIVFHGHACFEIVTNDAHRLLIDPFLSGNPQADVGPEAFERLDLLLVSHGHGDHLGDAVKIARRTHAPVLSTYELAAYVAKEAGVDAIGMNVGGQVRLPFGRVKLVPAIHTGSIGDTGRYATPVGFWIALEGGPRIYHAGDTALTMDMQLLRGQVDVALLPIGDYFTMGIEDAARAVEWIEPMVVVPMHYNTMKVIEQDPEAFRRAVADRAEVRVLRPGEVLEV